MKLSLRLSFYLRHSLKGYTVGTTMGFLVKIVEAFTLTISPPNPTKVLVVTYAYLFCLPSRGRFLPPAQWKARGLRPKTLEMIGFLQWQTTVNHTPHTR
jgi:hypothetical protein